MNEYIRKLVGNYAVPERAPYKPSVYTIYQRKGLEAKCTELTSYDDVCVIGLYDGS